MSEVLKIILIATATMTASPIIQLIGEEIKGVFGMLFGAVKSAFVAQVNINKKTAPKLCYALQLHIRSQVTSSISAAVDGFQSPDYRLNPGAYFIDVPEGKIIFNITDEQITVTSPQVSQSDLRKHLDKIYETHCGKDELVTFYTVKNGEWGFPIFRSPRKFKSTTPSMKVFEQDVETFCQDIKSYFNFGRPYKRGYLLVGKPQTGKTSSVELIAAKYNRDVYLVNLNSEGMNDAVLINLLSSVRPNSLIVFEEFDKQLEIIQDKSIFNLWGTFSRSQTKISCGGLLSAIDGPQRLPNGCLVILTANSMNFDSGFKRALLRPGRIDQVMLYKEKFDSSPTALVSKDFFKLIFLILIVCVIAKYILLAVIAYFTTYFLVIPYTLQIISYIW